MSETVHFDAGSSRGEIYREILPQIENPVVTERTVVGEMTVVVRSVRLQPGQSAADLRPAVNE